MPHEHIFYIPFVFLTGFVAGVLLARMKLDVPKTMREAPSSRKSGLQLLAALVALVIVFAGTHILPIPGGMKAVSIAAGNTELFDQRPSFTASEVQTRIEGFGPEGRMQYQIMTFTSDVIFPATLLAFLIMLRRAITSESIQGVFKRALLVLPVVWFLTDLFENVAIFFAISAYPAKSKFAEILGYVTVVKFSLLFAALGATALAAWGLGKSPNRMRYND